MKVVAFLFISILSVGAIAQSSTKDIIRCDVSLYHPGNGSTTTYGTLFMDLHKREGSKTFTYSGREYSISSNRETGIVSVSGPQGQILSFETARLAQLMRFGSEERTGVSSPQVTLPDHMEMSLSCSGTSERELLIKSANTIAPGRI